MTPDTFVRYFGLRRVANPKFDYPNVGAPPVSVLCEELLEEGETCNGLGQCSKQKIMCQIPDLVLILLPLIDAIKKDGEYEP